mmetsp:Transcript_77725/g.69561  ORF Transcript_77725/g.69561 Transcript_77725/m.69561 type:complete len:221 (+) Transcript_77725:129-791(+)
MSISKTSKMLNFINYKMRVTIQDGRQLVGTFMAFDKHMNLVLGDCEEFRKVKSKKGEPERVDKRTLGLLLLRGETVVSMQIEAPPPQKHHRGQAGLGGPGQARSAGRGMPVAPLSNAPQGLSHPVRGVGGASGAMMQPQIISQGPRPSGPPPHTGPMGSHHPPPPSHGHGHGHGPPQGMMAPPPGMMPPPPGMPGMGPPPQPMMPPRMPPQQPPRGMPPQ